MTDIESNVLYKTILDNYRPQFDIACRRSYVIALPVNEALKDVNIDQVLVNSHILMPSKLLKMHFTPLQVGYSADDIEMDGKWLIIHPTRQPTSGATNDGEQSVRKIRILAEEIGYNSENKPYRLLLIDKPLDDGRRPSSGGQSRQGMALLRSLSLFGPRKEKSQSAPDLLLDHYDCSRYLESISQQLTVELEREVQQIQSKYMILSQYLQDAADRVAQLTETFIQRYVELVGEKTIDSIRTSVENYAIHLLHGKLIASIYHRYERCDAKFDQKLELIRQSHSNVCQLGAQEPFRELEIDDKVINNLRDVASQQSPLAIVNTIVKIVDGINSNLNDCVRSRRLLMDLEASSNHEPKESVSICSDDLIASLIFALVQARPSRVYSMSKYLELFNWSARDKAAYYTATFHVVVQYIYNYRIECDEDGDGGGNSNNSSDNSIHSRN